MNKKPSSESRRKILHDAIIRRGGAHSKTTKSLRPETKVKLKKETEQ